MACTSPLRALCHDGRGGVLATIFVCEGLLSHPVNAPNNIIAKRVDLPAIFIGLDSSSEQELL
jgi:hypothetical protein